MREEEVRETRLRRGEVGGEFGGEDDSDDFIADKNSLYRRETESTAHVTKIDEIFGENSDEVLHSPLTL